MAIMNAAGRQHLRAAATPTAEAPPGAAAPGAPARPEAEEALESAEMLLWDTEQKLARLQQLLESLLFVADQPVALADLAKVLDLPRPAVERALKGLAESLEGRGLRLQRAGNQVQLVTAPEAAIFIQRFLGLESTARLSRAALETLSIIAYRQPATRPEIEAIRGVSAEGAVRTLLARGLVAPLGRRETVGQPVEYGTTFQFLEYFGIGSLDELPPLEQGLGQAAAEVIESAAAAESAPAVEDAAAPEAAGRRQKAEASSADGTAPAPAAEGAAAAAGA